jgi:hypothetical protein
MGADFVAGEEIVFRRVPNLSSMFSYPEGKLRLSSCAFNDPNQTPSVDRSKLLNDIAETAKTESTQGIVSLLTHRIRAIDQIKQSSTKGVYEFTYKLDVVADPQPPQNLAHALITSVPDLRAKSMFGKLKERLAILASEGGWTVRPTDMG